MGIQFQIVDDSIWDALSPKLTMRDFKAHMCTIKKVTFQLTFPNINCSTHVWTALQDIH